MGDQWEARLSVIENIQENFGRNIREMEEQLARLTSLFEDMAVHPRGPHPCRINGSLDHSSRPRAICHVELIAQPAAAKAHNSAFFRDNVPTYQSAKQLKGQT